MRIRYLIAILTILFSLTASSQSIQIASDKDDEVQAVEINHQNNLIIGGYYNNNCQFWNKNLTSLGQNDPYTSDGTTQDIFIAKSDTSLNLNWVKQFGGFFLNDLDELEIDQQNNIYFSATFFWRFYMGKDSLTGVRNWDNAIVKLSDKGDVQWSTAIKSSNDVEVNAMELDDNGDLYLAGSCEDSLIVNGDLHTDSLLTSFFVKLGSNGKLKTLKLFRNDFYITDMALTKNGISLSGELSEKPGYMGQKQLFGSDTSNRTFILNLDDQLKKQWEKLGHSPFASLTDITYLENNEALYCTGFFGNKLTFDEFKVTAKSDTGVNSKYDIDVVFFKMDNNNGKIQLSKSFGTPKEGNSPGFLKTINNKVIYGGQVKDSLKLFGKRIKTGSLREGFVGVLNPKGQLLEDVMTKGKAENISISEINDAALSPNGTLYSAGFYNAKAKIGDSTFTTKGANDGFLWKSNKLNVQLGINDNPNKPSNYNISIFPNPSDNKVKVVSKAKEEVNFRIFTTGGKEVEQFNLRSDGIKRINLKAGTYLFKFTKSDGNNHTRRIVIY